MSDIASPCRRLVLFTALLIETWGTWLSARCLAEKFYIFQWRAAPRVRLRLGGTLGTPVHLRDHE